MKIKIFFSTLFLSTLLIVNLIAQDMPLVYEVENTGMDSPIPYLPSFNELTSIQSLPDPFEWADGRGRIKNFSDWRIRRAEIGAQIQNYEIGIKPARPDSITASYSGNTLTVNVTVNGQTLTLTSQIILPSGTGRFPAVIGMNSPSGSIPSSIFSSRNIAQITYSHNQVTTYGNPQNSNPYYRLYPNFNIDNTGQYSAWSWGVSRIIDGLELVQDILPIDLRHIAVTGCSYAGKMALFAGAFDERIALTISQESGGGGYTTWRYSEEINKIESVETLGKTDYNWFTNSMKDFSSAVPKLPVDHHELMAMVAPRALLVTGNPGWVWLADESGYVGSKAAKEVWNTLGVPDRFGYSQIGGHNHCSVPSEQLPEIEAFVEKFLLGNDNVNTDISTSPYSTNLSPWITWSKPILSNDTSYFGKTSLIFPANLQEQVDTAITFSWNKVNDSENYYFQLSTSPTFANIVSSDSTLTDTVITIDYLSKGNKYYWRIKVKSVSGLSGPWSNQFNFITTTPFPDPPHLVSAIPYPNRADYIKFTWNSVEYGDQYLIELSQDNSFTNVLNSSTTSNTVKVLNGTSEGEKYYWRVQAKNYAGSSPWSQIKSFTVILPPTDLKLNSSELSEIILSWVDNSSVEDGYVIEQRQNLDTTYRTIDTLKGSGNEYVDKKVQQSLTYFYRIKAFKDSASSEYSNEVSLILTSIQEEHGIPTEFSISQNYPNPFNPATKINIALPQTELTKVSIYDILGKELQTLINRELKAGYHEINFSAANLTNGVYFYRIQAGKFTETKKLILLK